MPDSPNIFQQIQLACDDFRRRLKTNALARIEDYLTRVDESARANLFQQLLAAEITYRLQKGEQPNSHEYTSRFPEHTSLIRRALNEASMSSRDGIEQSPANEATLITELSIGQTIGDYELLRELGRGAFGIVYEARHRQRNDRVALKVLSFEGEPDADRLHRFRLEFRKLAEVNHSHLVGMQTLEYDDSSNQWFFTMDLVDGVDFLQHCRPDGQLNVDHLRAVLPQLVEAIRELHSHHIVHRDLKPSNVMVDHEGHLVVLDFGLVAELQERLDETVSARSAQFAGTLRYAAPEQLDGHRPAAADWYAMGVMIFEALTGEAPFHGSVADLMVQKKTLDAPELSGCGDLPADLTTLVDQLLARNPAERPDEAAIVTTLSTDGGSSLSAASEQDESYVKHLPQITLVGREAQLTQLGAIRQEWRDADKPVVVFVSGRSGEGKTALIERFLEPLRRETQTLVLSGKCYDRESVPYKAIDGLIEALVSHLRRRPDDEVTHLLPEDAQMLVHLFPITRRVAVMSSLEFSLAKRLDAKQVRDRAFNALKEMLRRISLQTALIMFLDDLQWGDHESAGVLTRLLSPPDPPVALVIGSFRVDEAAESPFLKQWNSDCPKNNSVESVPSDAATPRQERHPQAQSSLPVLYDVTVGPLSESQCVQLVRTHTGDNSTLLNDRARKIFRATAGNPYLIDQLLECIGPSSSTLITIPLNELIARRLHRLPSEAVSLLDVIAVAGHAVSTEEVAEAAEVDDSVFATLNRMRNERLVRLIGSGRDAQVDTYHDKIRETVLCQLSSETLRESHSRLGQTIERKESVSAADLWQSVESGDDDINTPARVFDLAYHFEAARDERKSLTYTLLAAEHAASQFAIDVAIENYQIALERSSVSSISAQYRVAVRFAETLVLAGRFNEASAFVKQAKGVAQSDFEHARIEAVLGEIAYKSGSITRSIELFELALGRIGTRVPKPGVGLAVAIGWQALVQFGQQILPRRWYARSTEAGPASELKFRLIHRVNYPYHFRNTPRQTWSTLLLANLGGRSESDSSFALAQVVSSVSVNSTFGWDLRGNQYLQRALQAAQRGGDKNVSGTVLRLSGYSLLGVGRFTEAAATFQEAAVLFQDEIPDFWQRILSRLWLSTSLFRMGRIMESAELSCEIFAIAVRARQDRVAQMAMDPLARATDGGLPFLELRKKIQLAPDDITTTIQLMIAETLHHIHRGETNEAVSSAEAAVELLKKHWIMNLWTVSAISTIARALREHADRLARDGNRQCRAYRMRSLRVSRWAVRVSRFLKIDYPTSLRELSLALAASGRLGRALRYAHQSCAVAEKQCARYEYSQSLLVCGQLGEKLGKQSARQQIEQAEAQLVDFDRQIELANREAVERLALREETGDGR